MKANRKFVQADEAVSPVIAVILMVAITVVLAATVFVLVSDIGGNTGSAAPQISWNPDETQDRLAVNTASNNADWNRLTIQTDSCSYLPTGETPYVLVAGVAGPPVTLSINTATTAANGQRTDAVGASGACGAAAAKRVGTASAKITAGDFLDFCFDDTGVTSMTSVKVVVKDTTANSVVLTHTFTDLSVCP